MEMLLEMLLEMRYDDGEFELSTGESPSFSRSPPISPFNLLEQKFQLVEPAGPIAAGTLVPGQHCWPILRVSNERFTLLSRSGNVFVLLEASHIDASDTGAATAAATAAADHTLL